MPLNLAKRGECCGIGGADPLVGVPSGPGRPRPAFGTTVSVPGGAQEADGGVVPRGDPMVLGIGVKTSGGGHKMLETQSTSPTLHGGLVDHRGLILTPMMVLGSAPQFVQTFGSGKNKGHWPILAAPLA